MKRTLIITAIMALVLPAAAQTTSRQDYATKYENQVKYVGSSGIGVENILDKWEADYPDDVDMLVARFNYYYNKSQSVKVEPKDAQRYLGEKPLMTLKDTLGRDVNYFQEVVYDDSLFALSSQAIDKAVKVAPERLDIRYVKVTSLLAYEKESPDMATAALSGLIDYNGTSHPAWKYGEEKVDAEFFATGIQEYCAQFYTIASPVSYESFKSLSEKMLKYEPKNNLFLTNLGTYYFVVKKDNKQALKYYNKVLKSEPSNYTAIKNCVVMARHEKDVKLEKKYLAMLAKYSPDERERTTSQARLNAMNQSK